MGYIGTEPLIASNGGTGVNNLNTSTITLGGALTLTGAFTTEFIVSGNTSVTLPTSGTLATTTGGIGGWVDSTGATQTITAGLGYLSNRGAGSVTFSLPAASVQGDVFAIVGVQNGWVLQAGANQQIFLGSGSSTVAGTLTSTDAGDCIELVALNTSANSLWRVKSSIGNITAA